MRKIIALAILGAMSATALADVDVKGNFGYRYDSQQAGNTTVNQDRMKAELKISSQLNDETKVVLGLATGDAKTRYVTFGGNNSLKNIDLNLAYVEYAPIASTKVVLGKMHQPWATSSLFFDKDIKPEGLAVAFDAGHGLKAAAYQLTVAEGGLAPDSRVKGFQVGVAKDIAGLKASAFAGLQNHDSAIPGSAARAKSELTHLGASVGKGPFTAFIEQTKNDKAATGDTAKAYGVTFGKAAAPGTWDFTVMHQEVEANALPVSWMDSDFGANAAKHEGNAFVVNYVVAKGWVINGKYYDTEVGPTKINNKRLLVDLNYMF